MGYVRLPTILALVVSFERFLLQADVDHGKHGAGETAMIMLEYTLSSLSSLALVSPHRLPWHRYGNFVSLVAAALQGAVSADVSLGSRKTNQSVAELQQQLVSRVELYE
jgi:hypothetical protein